MRSVIHTLFVFLVLAGWSCDRNEPLPELREMEQLVVDPSFDWSTSRDVRFQISSAASTVIRIENPDRTVTYHKGFYNGYTEQYVVVVGLAKDVTQVLINGLPVAVTSGTVSYTLPVEPRFKSGQQLPTPISFWNFDEGTGSKLTDRQGTNHGSIVAASWVEGFRGQALRFDGVAGNVDIPHSESMQVLSKVTLMAWVKTENYASVKIAQKGDWDGFGIYLDVWKGWKAAIYRDDRTTHDVSTPDGRPVLNQWYHIAMTYDGQYLKLYVNGTEKGSNNAPGLLFLNSRSFSIGSDNAIQKFFKGTIDEVYLFGEALAPEQIGSIYKDAPNGDRDGDGITDEDDDFPDDRERAFTIAYPAGSNGSLAFEDLWPGTGDYDFNDLVLDYRFHTVTSAANLVREVRADITLRAIGASLPGGFGFQLGGDKLAAADLKVTGYDIQSDLYKLNANGTEAGQQHPTIIVFDRASRLLRWQSGSGVNTESGSPYTEPVTLSVLIEIVSGTYTQEDIDISRFNPFMVVSDTRGREIHLPDHRPTDLASTELFGTGQDDSDALRNRYYKTGRNLPWALNLIESFDYPVEKAPITSAHLMFFDWAVSGGVQYADWYRNLDSYRSVSHIYRQ